MTSRLEKFRSYMARLNPAGNPGYAIRDGLYVPRPGRSTADEIAARLELDPASSHLVIGGIGSGKTTQLLVARDRLSALPDTYAEYIDVSEIHEISRMKPGTLVVIAGLALGRLLDETSVGGAPMAKAQFERWAYGFPERIPVGDEGPPDEDWDEPPDEDDGPYRLIQQEPVLSSPHKPLHPDVNDKAHMLALLRDGLSARFPHLVLLMDSLDRLSDPAIFTMLVEEDVRAICEAGIGIVLVGPLRSMYGTYRSVTDHFQHFYPQPAVDVQQDEQGRSFLMNVLRKRAPEDLLPDASCRRLAELSGGVLRDLISLARGAGENAYMNGADQIEGEHVEAAADAFGRQLIFGLHPAELEVLQRVRDKGTFVQTSDQDLAFLVTRRVLEYQNGRARFAVHPTLKPLLEQLKPIEHAL